MNAETFSRGFDRESKPDTRAPEAAAEQLPERPEQWSRAFGHILHDYLSSGEPGISVDDFSQLSDEYISWYRTDFMETLRIATEHAEQENTNDAYRVVNNLNFHHLNRLMLPVWTDALFSEKGIQRQSAREAQTSLSAYGMEMAKVRQGKIAQDDYFTPERAIFRRVNNGILNEFDTAVILLNISVDNPDIAILPGPRQFEKGHNNSSRSSDFVAIRRSDRQARGIQAKSGFGKSDYENYDPNYVTMIDGANDLGNTLALRTNPYKSKKTSVAWPGHISLEHLRGIKVDDPDFSRLNKKYLLQSKFQARALSKSTTPYLKKATSRVRTRILNDLERQDSLIG